MTRLSLGGTPLSVVKSVHQGALKRRAAFAPN
jgi:hypothetical protein